MKTTNERIWDAADEADRLADHVQRRLDDKGQLHDVSSERKLLSKLRAELSAIKRLSNDRPGGA